MSSGVGWLMLDTQKYSVLFWAIRLFKIIKKIDMKVSRIHKNFDFSFSLLGAMPLFVQKMKIKDW